MTISTSVYPLANVVELIFFDEIHVDALACSCEQSHLLPRQGKGTPGTSSQALILPFGLYTGLPPDA